MKRENVSLCALALLFCLISATVAWAQSQEQPSLGNIAKQKSAAKAKRVITNDEIPPSPEANAAPAAASAPSSSAGASAPAANPQDKKAEGKAATSSEQETKLQALMKEHESLGKIIATLQQQIDSTNDENRITTLTSVVQHAKEQLAENQQEIDKLKASGAAAGQRGGSPAAAAQPPAPRPAPK